MFDRNQRVEDEPEVAKRKFAAYVRALLAGRTAEELNAEEVWILGAHGVQEEQLEQYVGAADDELPKDIAQALGFKPGTTYGDVVGESLTAVHMQSR